MPSTLVPYRSWHLCHLIILLLIHTNFAIERNIGISFSSVPESRVAPPGDHVFFHCKTNIGKGQQIRWIHNGNRLDRQSKFVKIGDGELTIRVKKKRRHEGQIGRYQCVAGMKNRLLMSPPATLSVASLGEFPERSALPDTITANVGNTVMISCEVPDSNPPAIIQWQRGPFTNLTGTPVNTSAEGISVVSSGALLLQDIQEDHAGSYACQATNPLTFELRLSPHPVVVSVLAEDERHKPRLLVVPDNEYHTVQGEQLTIPCSASGSPKPTIMWEHEKFNQQPVVLDPDGPSELLHLTNLSSDSSGTYSCKIWNGRGRFMLRKTYVYVAEKPTANITSFPGPFKEGGPLELYCEAKGFPIPTVYWVFNGIKKHFGSSDLSDPTKAKLLTPSLRLSDAGVYQCFAENSAGVAIDAVLVGVVPGVRAMGEGEEEDEHRGHHRRRNHNSKVKPSPPTVVQKSQDSVVITWTMDTTNLTDKIQFFKVQYRDLGLKNRDGSCNGRHEEAHQPLHTKDGEIAPNIRDSEIPGLLKDHCYRFKVSAVFEDNDSSQSRFSPKFKMETRLQAPPRAIPMVTDILTISDNSLSINWKLPENATTRDKITGYFILFRESTSAGNYSHLTILGEGTHSHILDNLKPGTQYDIKVQAFNLNGAGHYSKMQPGRTNKKKRKNRGRKKLKLLGLEGKQDEVEDEDATLYLVIGTSLGLVCVVGLTACSVFTCLKRRRGTSKFSDSNAAIHSKYQDTSLQITGQHQEQTNRGLEEVGEWRVGDAAKGGPDTSTESGVHETSFSVSPTDHSFDGLDDSSQGSTALAQDHSRGNLNFTASPPIHLDYSLESLAEEYTDEPSIGWKRRRRSEEIL